MKPLEYSWKDLIQIMLGQEYAGKILGIYSKNRTESQNKKGQNKEQPRQHLAAINCFGNAKANQ